MPEEHILRVPYPRLLMPMLELKMTLQEHKTLHGVTGFVVQADVANKFQICLAGKQAVAYQHLQWQCFTKIYMHNVLTTQALTPFLQGDAKQNC